MKAQVAEVNHVLGSVYQMNKAGNRLIFDTTEENLALGGYIENRRSGSNTFMEVNQTTVEFQFVSWVKAPEVPTHAVSDSNREHIYSIAGC